MRVIIFHRFICPPIESGFGQTSTFKYVQVPGIIPRMFIFANDYSVSPAAISMREKTVLLLDFQDFPVCPHFNWNSMIPGMLPPKQYRACKKLLANLSMNDGPTCRLSLRDTSTRTQLASLTSPLYEKLTKNHMLAPRVVAAKRYKGLAGRICTG